MDISQRGIDLIFGSEGKHKLLPDGRYKAYLDTLAKPPVWTIYAGLTKGVREGMVVSKDQGDHMFAKECTVYEDVIDRLVKVPLNQNQFDALVSFVYNCGPNAFENSTLLKMLNAGKYEQVPAQLKRWTHAGGVEYAGLVTRRKAEGALFLEPMPHELAPMAEEAAVEVVDGEPVAPVPVLPAVLPQRVEAAPVESVATSVTSSTGIKIAAVAVPGASYSLFNTAWDWIFGIAKEAGPHISDIKTTLTPLDALIKMTPMLLAALTVGCVVALLIKRIIDRRVGKDV